MRQTIKKVPEQGTARKPDANQIQKVLDRSEDRPSDLSILEDEENIEVGLELTLSERVFLAWFCQVSRFKIMNTEHFDRIGAPFIEQVVAVFGTEVNFNVLQTDKN